MSSFGISNYNKLRALLKHMKGMDDARGVNIIPLLDILSGKIVKAFGHSSFYPQLLEVFGRLDLLVPTQVITELAIYRNILLIIALNAEYERINSKGGFLKTDGNRVELHKREITEDMLHIISPENKARLENLCSSLNIDPSGYMQPDLSDDITSCLTEFCLGSLKDTVTKTTDCVIMIQDLDGELYVLLIERAFGPHRKAYAFPGGFVDIKNGVEETFVEAGNRELGEEISGAENLYDTTYFQKRNVSLQVFTGMTWDARHQFGLHGTQNGGVGVLIQILRPLPDEWLNDC